MTEIKEAASPVLAIDDLTVSYASRQGATQAVRDVSLRLDAGECVGLVGESGCGKSTIAWSILGYLGRNGAVEQGRIRFLGEDLVGRGEKDLRRLRGDRIGMVYQDPLQSLNPAMRIGDQMAEALTFHQSLRTGEARERCEQILERVHLPNPPLVLNAYPHQLSGGQQQRIVIAMALLNNPALLIMDEPTTALDVTVEATVLDLVAELRRDFDTAILFVSHNLGVVARICDRVAGMYAGELVETAAVEQLFRRPAHPYTRGLLACIPRLTGNRNGRLYSIPGRVPGAGQPTPACRFAPRCPHAVELCHDEPPALRAVGNSYVRCHFAGELERLASDAGERRPPAVEAQGALQVTGLEARYPVRNASLLSMFGGPSAWLRAVDGVDFELPAGSTLGIVGESGCGKSTLVKTLIGLEETAAGEAEFLGFDLAQPLRTRDRELIREVQMVFQNPESTLNPSFSVGRQISRCLRVMGGVRRDRLQEETVAMLEAVKLDSGYYDRLPRQLSGGEKQRVGIARAFASRPDLVLCDEPVSALDVSVQSAILNLLLEIQHDHGTTMVVIAHDLAVVRYVSDYVAVMYLGKLVELGPVEAVYAPPYHPYTQALLAAAPSADPELPVETVRLQGNVPSAIDPPGGCAFHSRCPLRSLLPDAGAVCEIETPPQRETGPGHHLYCHLKPEQLGG